MEVTTEVAEEADNEQAGRIQSGGDATCDNTNGCGVSTDSTSFTLANGATARGSGR